MVSISAPNSIGWWLYQLDEKDRPRRSVNGGARIFPDGREPSSGNKEGSSLAVERRMKRSARRRRDRYLRRREVLMQALVSIGLMPLDPHARKMLEVLDPFALRAKALDHPLPVHHVGRALFHLNQRRGFQSNRKADRRDKKERGKIETGISRLRDAMGEEGTRTFGEFLHMRRQKGLSVRARLRSEQGENAKGDGYDFYPERTLPKEEFEAIWRAQSPHHPDIMTTEAHNRLRHIIFGQRPLKPPLVGRCTFVNQEQRLPRAHPLFQELRLYQEVNHLWVEETGHASRPLSREERDRLILALQSARTKGFASLRRLLSLPEHARFNKETENRKKLLGNEVHRPCLPARRHSVRAGRPWIGRRNGW